MVSLLPKENRKDLIEIPRRVLKALRLVLVDHMDDVLGRPVLGARVSRGQAVK